MCGVCISRRGMVYFGASIHIFVTLILFLGSTFRAYRISSYEREENSKQLLGATLIAMYFFTLLILGCLIFRGVEHKSPKMLGWSGGTFITLETFAFVFNLLLLSPMGGAYDEYGLRNFGFTVDVFQIILSLIFLGCMAGYCVVIILYILKLREDDAGSEYTYGEFDDAGTIPAPPVATNLSRSSTVHSNYSVHHNSKSSNTQLTQAGSHGHLSQCNSQYHIGSGTSGGGGGGGGQNHQNPGGLHKSPELQDRRLHPRVNHLSQEGLNEASTNTGGSPPYFHHHHQRILPYAGGSGYSSYTQQLRPMLGGGGGGGGGAPSAGIPYRQSQTLPHPHHYHRQMPSIPGSGVGRESSAGGVAASTQFPSRSRMDIASLSQTLTRNPPMVKRVGTAMGGPLLGNIPATSSDPTFEGDTWEERPRVQALKYNYGGGSTVGGIIRKGVSGTNVGIEV